MLLVAYTFLFPIVRSGVWIEKCILPRDQPFEPHSISKHRFLHCGSNLYPILAEFVVPHIHLSLTSISKTNTHQPTRLAPLLPQFIIYQIKATFTVHPKT